MPAITDLSDPLSDEELERPQTILLDRVDEDAVTDGKDEGVLDVSELDGLLTAVVSGPVTIVPSRWLPAVWGDFEPTWHSVDDYGAFMSMLMRHMNSIAETLIDEPEAFSRCIWSTFGRARLSWSSMNGVRATCGRRSSGR